MLPIGSIVYLKDGMQKMMILNRGPIVVIEKEQCYFDYSACEYPAGLIQDKIFYFNEENISEVIFEGYSDEKEKRFEIVYKDWLKQNPELKKGTVNRLLN
ncbi:MULTISPECIES: DUF4176 domain-containing protein [Listeria]|uniref:DUF4176 domain-containing protein n=1 Tax=Listeria TaxID=1637 RepID=UPI000B591219|nr:MULTISPECIES: DUF4176 domain-containing protein [Listeria]